MVQEFHVVRCFSCQSFQVQQVKKVNKWTCKLCGEKQTLQKEFGRGSGADCRRHVQKLNAMRGAVMEEQEHHTWSLWEQAEEEEEEKAPEDQEEEHQVSSPQGSRWSKYLDTPKDDEDEDEAEDEQNVLMERTQLRGNYMTDRKRKRDGGRDHDTPEQHKPGLMRPPKTTRTTSFTPTSLTQARTSITNPNGPNQTRTTSLNSTSVTQTRTTFQNPTSVTQNRTTFPNSNELTQTRTTSLKSTSVTQTRTTIPNQTGPKKTCQNWSSPPSSGLRKTSKWTCFLSSDDQGQIEEGPSDSGCTALNNDVTTQPPALARPRPLLPVSSMFESGDEFSFDNFLSDDF